VVEGRKRGIFKSWSEAEQQVKGHPGARFKGFTDEQPAIDWFHENKIVYIIKRGETIYIPPYGKDGKPTKKDRKGRHKPVYFNRNGVRMANYGRTIGRGHPNYDYFAQQLRTNNEDR